MDKKLSKAQTELLEKLKAGDRVIDFVGVCWLYSEPSSRVNRSTLKALINRRLVKCCGSTPIGAEWLYVDVEYKPLIPAYDDTEILTF